MQASLPRKQQQRPSKHAMQARKQPSYVCSLSSLPLLFPPHTHTNTTLIAPTHHPTPTLPLSSSTPSEISCTIISRRNTYPQHTRPPRRRHAPARATAQSTRYASQQQNSNTRQHSLPSSAHTLPPSSSDSCTQVLLAALVKARGMPARVCHGLVYVEQGGSAISGREGDAGSVQQAEVNADGTAEAAAAADGGDGGGGLTGQFGWHMWSQAMVSENAAKQRLRTHYAMQ